MKNIETILDKFLGPIANWMSQNKFFAALAEAFMRTTPITLGASFLMLIGNFPIPAWIRFLNNVGLSSHFTAVVGGSFNALSLFVAFNFAYVYVKNQKESPLTPGLLSTASFLILAPQILQVPVLEKAVTEFPSSATVTAVNQTEAFQTIYLGGPGLLVAIFVGYVTAILYLALKKRNLMIKLPASVPPNVAESLSPTFVAGIIFSFFFLIRLGFSYTPFESIFHFVYGLLQAPLQALTASPISIIVIFTLANLFWFFGIHPNVVYAIVTPVLMANFTANTNAFIAGKAVPYLMMAVVYSFTSNAFGGQGGTYGLVLSMFRAKSSRYKELVKLSAAPSLFNINEPLIFGTPIMLNPIFFFPMILGPVIQGGIAWGLALLLKVDQYNAAIQLPWTMPTPITAGIVGGWKFIVIAAVVLAANFFLWYPFFKVADSTEWKKEQEVLNSK